MAAEAGFRENSGRSLHWRFSTSWDGSPRMAERLPGTDERKSWDELVISSGLLEGSIVKDMMLTLLSRNTHE